MMIPKKPKHSLRTPIQNAGHNKLPPVRRDHTPRRNNPGILPLAYRSFARPKRLLHNSPEPPSRPPREPALPLVTRRRLRPARFLPLLVYKVRVRRWRCSGLFKLSLAAAIANKALIPWELWCARARKRVGLYHLLTMS